MESEILILAMRLRLRIRVNERSIDVIALLNSGFEDYSTTLSIY